MCQPAAFTAKPARASTNLVKYKHLLGFYLPLLFAIIVKWANISSESEYFPFTLLCSSKGLDWIYGIRSDALFLLALRLLSIVGKLNACVAAITILAMHLFPTIAIFGSLFETDHFKIILIPLFKSFAIILLALSAGEIFEALREDLTMTFPGTHSLTWVACILVPVGVTAICYVQSHSAQQNPSAVSSNGQSEKSTATAKERGKETGLSILFRLLVKGISSFHSKCITQPSNEITWDAAMTIASVSAMLPTINKLIQVVLCPLATVTFIGFVICLVLQLAIYTLSVAKAAAKYIAVFSVRIYPVGKGFVTCAAACIKTAMAGCFNLAVVIKNGTGPLAAMIGERFKNAWNTVRTYVAGLRPNAQGAPLYVAGSRPKAQIDAQQFRKLAILEYIQLQRAKLNAIRENRNTRGNGHEPIVVDLQREQVELELNGGETDNTPPNTPASSSEDLYNDVRGVFDAE
jgi:hypothetical protein